MGGGRRVVTARFEWLTPTGAGGALAAVALHGDQAEILRRIGVRDLGVGEVAVADVAGVDLCAIARVGERVTMLMPHAGAAVAASLTAALTRAGFEATEQVGASSDPRSRFPEASDIIEACVLDALGWAASPRAIDVLLAQPSRWRQATARGGATVGGTAGDPWSAALDRLLRPPLVVAGGPTNIGKSTLLNALAGREVAVAADEPGVTRDHVGALVVCDGLAVRWIDTPGMRETADPLEREARAASARVIAQSDLVISCGDASSGFLGSDALPPSRAPALLVETRADLRRGAQAPVGSRLSTAAVRGEGLEALAIDVRRALVPDEALAWTGPWRFHPALPA